MISSRTLLASFLCAAFVSSPGIAQDFAKYRDFEFGTSMEAVAKQVRMKVSDAKTTQQRPAVIQMLQWDQGRSSDLTGKVVSVRSIRFDFYNDELSRMVVTYDPGATDGLTTDDLIE